MSNILYIEGSAMTHQEKRAWIMLLVALLAYLSYVLIIVSRRHGGALADVPYAGTLLWTVGASVAATILLDMVTGGPRRKRLTDVRDRQIGRMGDYAGQAFVVLGAVSAMLMAMAGWHRFWIANVIYLGFTLSAVLSSLAKISMYRGELPPW